MHQANRTRALAILATLCLLVASRAHANEAGELAAHVVGEGPTTIVLELARWWLILNCEIQSGH